MNFYTCFLSSGSFIGSDLLPKDLLVLVLRNIYRNCFSCSLYFLSFNLFQPLKISGGLETLLAGMTNRNPTDRIALVKVLEVGHK